MKTLLFIVCAICCCGLCDRPLPAQDDKPSPQAQSDKYRFDSRDHSDDTTKGFAVGLKLIHQAQEENAPPETIARLYYHTANIRLLTVLTSETPAIDSGMIRPAITMLNKVLKDPDRFLANEKSAVWYANCSKLLFSIYQKKDDSRAELRQAMEFALLAIEASDSLNQTRQRTVAANIRLGCSDISLADKDWDAAIAWLQPIIESADKFMVDGTSAATLAMMVRQQSMFLAKNDQWDQSADLIDNMCQKFEEAKTIQASDRLFALCMLRGKTFVNFSRNMDHPLAVDGWDKYKKLADRVVTYDGPDKASVLGAATNMDRLAASCIYDQNSGAAIESANHAMQIVESNLELLTPKSSALFNTLSTNDNVYRKLPPGDPRKVKFKQKMDSYIELLQKNGVDDKAIDRYRR